MSLQVKVSNPSIKSLTYNILLAGRDARDFSVPRGSSVTIGARQTIPLSVEFTSRYLRPAEAMLVLIGTRQGANTGCTLTFKLRTQIDNITPAVSVECWWSSLWMIWMLCKASDVSLCIQLLALLLYSHFCLILAFIFAFPTFRYSHQSFSLSKIA